jgi:hypothetical protein
MRVLPVQLTAFVAALLMVGSVGCGKETVLMVAPVVTAVTPANGATGVVPGVAPTATFSVAMNPTTINASTFTLSAPGGVAIVGSVAYNAVTLVAVFTPAASLAYNTTYTATVTTGVMDTLGDETARNTVWSFTTATQPTVLSTVPTAGALNVPITQVLTATFSDESGDDRELYVLPECDRWWRRPRDCDV